MLTLILFGIKEGPGPIFYVRKILWKMGGDSPGKRVNKKLNVSLHQKYSSEQ